MVEGVGAPRRGAPNHQILLHISPILFTQIAQIATTQLNKHHCANPRPAPIFEQFLT